MKIEIVQFIDGSYAVRKESSYLFFWKSYQWLTIYNAPKTDPYFSRRKDIITRCCFKERAELLLKAYYLSKLDEKDYGTPI